MTTTVVIVGVVLISVLSVIVNTPSNVWPDLWWWLKKDWEDVKR